MNLIPIRSIRLFSPFGTWDGQRFTLKWTSDPLAIIGISHEKEKRSSPSSRQIQPGFQVCEERSTQKRVFWEPFQRVYRKLFRQQRKKKIASRSDNERKDIYRSINRVFFLKFTVEQVRNTIRKKVSGRYCHFTFIKSINHTMSQNGLSSS